MTGAEAAKWFMEFWETLSWAYQAFIVVVLLTAAAR